MDKLPVEEENDHHPPKVKVGDRVQVTVHSQDLYPDGSVVLGFSEDGLWAFTDQSKGGVKLEEITVLEAAKPVEQERPMIPASLLAAVKTPAEDANLEVRTGTRKAVFPVSEGDVALVFPKDITAAGLRELGLYLDIFLKKEEAAATKQ